MSLTLYVSRVRQSFHRLTTLGLPVAFVSVKLAWDVAMLMYINFTFIPELLLPEDIFLLPLFLGLAATGRDASEGLLPLLLTRPVRRSSYVLSQWAALGTVSSFWALLHLVLQWGLLHTAAPQGHRLMEVLYNGLGRVSVCFGISAALVCFAARLPSYGNVLLWGVLYYLVRYVLPGLGQGELLKLVFTFRQYLEGLIMPTLDFRKTFAATPISWFRLTTYLSNVSLLLLLAIHIFNRREVSYASR